MRTRFYIASTLLLSLNSVASAEAFFSGPDGIEATCSGLHNISSGKNAARQKDGGPFNVKYANWTQEIADFLKKAADSCASMEIDQQTKAWQAMGRTAPTPTETRRSEQIYRRRDVIKRDIDKIIADANTGKAENDVRARLAACTSTTQSVLYAAQEKVIFDFVSINGAKKALEHERRVAQVSGVQNLSNERMFGEAIVIGTDNIGRDFAAYRQLGGTAQTPQEVKHELRDPCAGKGLIIQ